MADIELRYEYLPIEERLLLRPLTRVNFKPVRVYFSIPDGVFVNTYIDSETGELVNGFPAELLLELLTKNMVVTIEPMNY